MAVSFQIGFQLQIDQGNNLPELGLKLIRDPSDAAPRSPVFDGL